MMYNFDNGDTIIDNSILHVQDLCRDNFFRLNVTLGQLKTPSCVPSLHYFMGASFVYSLVGTRSPRIGFGRKQGGKYMLFRSTINTCFQIWHTMYFDMTSEYQFGIALISSVTKYVIQTNGVRIMVSQREIVKGAFE